MKFLSQLPKNMCYVLFKHRSKIQQIDETAAFFADLRVTCESKSSICNAFAFFFCGCK